MKNGIYFSVIALLVAKLLLKDFDLYKLENLRHHNMDTK